MTLNLKVLCFTTFNIMSFCIMTEKWHSTKAD